MQIKDLIEGLAFRVERGSATVALSDLTDDSRQVAPGWLFVARDAAYIDEALQRGAVAIISETRPPVSLNQSVTWITAPCVDQRLAGLLAERFFGHPSAKLKLIGITGTNGKTTTAFLVQHLLQQAGVKCGLIGTVFIDDGAERQTAELTTPGAIEFSRLLARMVEYGCTAAAAEVSSHALHQGRTAALKFDVAVFTNLTGDHLDYHGTMEDYADAKAILFSQLDQNGWAVVNADDSYGSIMADRCAGRVLWCTMRAAEDAREDAGEPDICRATALELKAGSSRARFDGPWGSLEVRLPLVGKHNVFNMLQAIAAATAVTPTSRMLREAIAVSPAVPGRLEPVMVAMADERRPTLPTVLVDYAHTHDALENVLLALRPVVRGRLIVVFGCGGDRDRSKRPKMAQVACRLADWIIMTSDNPRTEDPDSIIAEIQTGVPAEAMTKVVVEVDRARAIALAVERAGEGDTVLLAGKGHEDYQIVARPGGGVEKRHFDDREHAAAALHRRASVVSR